MVQIDIFYEIELKMTTYYKQRGNNKEELISRKKIEPNELSPRGKVLENGMSRFLDDYVNNRDIENLKI